MQLFRADLKWGCDGSQQSQFKQKMQSHNATDSNIFQSSLVPLQLVCGTNRRKVVWQHPTPSSPRYCRPTRIRFTKETSDVTKDEINYVENQTRSLEDCKYSKEDVTASVKCAMTFTKVDAKVSNAAAQTKSAMRYLLYLLRRFNNFNRKLDVNFEAL